MAVTPPHIVPRVTKTGALAEHHVPTGEPLVTPDVRDKVAKKNAAVGHLAFNCVKKRQQAVATASRDNGVDALSGEMHQAIDEGLLLLTDAVMATCTTTVDAPIISTVAKRRRIVRMSKPKKPTTVSEQTGPPKTKCQGCVHGDLLELKVMEPVHIRHYLKPAAFLETATCAGDCKLVMRAIHLASPKANLYYCDENLKGYYAHDNNPTKAGMECLFVLCSPCHVIREVQYAQAHEKEGAGKRRTSRRGTNK